MNLFVSLALLIGLILSLFPQDSQEAKVIFVLTQGKVSGLPKSHKAKEAVSETAGREKPKSEEKVDGEAEAKKRKKRRRNKAKKNRELYRWLRKKGKTIVSILIKVKFSSMDDEQCGVIAVFLTQYRQFFRLIARLVKTANSLFTGDFSLR